nr:hypothetical protein [Pseudomonas fragi]
MPWIDLLPGVVTTDLQQRRDTISGIDSPGGRSNAQGSTADPPSGTAKRAS